MRLTREVRFCLTPDAPAGGITNSWSGWPPWTGLAPYLIVQATFDGDIDRRTGYVCNIAVIDRVLRDQAIPRLRRHWLDAPPGTAACEPILPSIASAVAGAMPPGVRLDALTVRVTPLLSYAYRPGADPMITLTQSFEFSAAHRLYCPEFDEERNRQLFGKCTNPKGHGHNYVVEVTVRGRPDSAGGLVIEVPALDRIVRQRVIDVFDHKHLNEDCPEFADLNPTVENITRVIWDRLAGSFGRAALEAVRVYETPKTWSEYRDPAQKKGPPSGEPEE